MGKILPLITVLIAVLLAPRAVAHHQTTPGAHFDRSSCGAVKDHDFSSVQDAPTHVNSTRLVEAEGRLPEYCEVEGYVSPQVGFLMWLPTTSWNGKFMEVGCGEFCGGYEGIILCKYPIAHGYACVTTDMGHKGAEDSVEWAYNNPNAVIDFAYRATHVTALAGKAIAAAYYGRNPSKSYFHGCSGGGRQGLVEAERFPWDFSGIIVGAPAISYSDIAIASGRKASLLIQSGKPLFDAQAISVLDRAIVEKCDMNDGLKDGLIGDPRLCKFDPRSLICSSSSSRDCLSATQATTAFLLYSDQTSASGERVGERASLPGWEVSYIGLSVGNALMSRSFYEDFFKYLGFSPNPGPSWKFETFDPNRDYKRLGLIRSLLDADNPDLSEFKQAGGKMILYHGWADGGPSPNSTVEFYKKIERLMGGPDAARTFVRLFMVPDMDHCGGGKGAWQIDYLGYLEKWVEQDTPPERMIGAHYGGVDSATWATDPISQNKPQFTRPVFPFPLRAQFKGSGDPNNASSFEPVDMETSGI